MKDIPEAEARELLAVPSVCPEALPWRMRARPLLTYEAGAGLVDANGNPRGMYVELCVGQTSRAHLRALNLTVFRNSASGPERVYQLSIVGFPRLPADVHAHPHEHYGRSRYVHADWLGWSYDEALDHFKRATNITFDPDVGGDPAEFRLQP